MELTVFMIVWGIENVEWGGGGCREGKGANRIKGKDKRLLA